MCTLLASYCCLPWLAFLFIFITPSAVFSRYNTFTFFRLYGKYFNKYVTRRELSVSMMKYSYIINTKNRFLLFVPVGAISLWQFQYGVFDRSWCSIITASTIAVARVLSDNNISVIIFLLVLFLSLWATANNKVSYNNNFK